MFYATPYAPWLIPSQNAFVARLGRDFNPSKMLVVDLLHEFELGVWRTLFTQLIRLLEAAGKGSEMLVAELDSRFLHNHTESIANIIIPIDTVKSRHLAPVPFESFPKIHLK